MPNVSKKVEKIQGDIMDLIVDFYDNYPLELMSSIQLLELAGKLAVIISQKTKKTETPKVRYQGVEYKIISRVLSEKEFEIFSEYSANYLPIEKQQKIEQLQEKMLKIIFDFVEKKENNLSNLDFLDFAGRLLIASAQKCETHLGVVVKVNNIYHMALCHAISPGNI